jgi:predicted transglutaminase-like protease
MNEAKVGVDMKEVNLKDAHVAIKKIITWIKKSGKGKHECKKACYEVGL